jgi:hypothetical protein
MGNPVYGLGWHACKWFFIKVVIPAVAVVTGGAGYVAGKHSKKKQ